MIVSKSEQQVYRTIIYGKDEPLCGIFRTPTTIKLSDIKDPIQRENASNAMNQDELNAGLIPYTVEITVTDTNGPTFDDSIAYRPQNNMSVEHPLAGEVYGIISSFEY